MTNDPDWITPIEALTMVKASGVSPLETIPTLRKWASHGEVRAIARSVFIRFLDSTRKDVPLSELFWTESDQDTRFRRLENFGAGTFVSVLEIEHEGKLSALEAEAVGVRFSKSDLDATTGSGATSAPINEAAAIADKPRSKLPPLTGDKLNEFWRLFQPINDREKLTEEQCGLVLEVVFPDRHVSRDRIRVLRGPQKRGPKGFRGEVSAE